ncbi:hypothetical protein FJ960_28045 [Mesorhizobium sp. B2-3-11]|uniref:hypothetical protein n=1 Tax=Mesorhizobium sp. B2-3-11 TaxID=2589953 RepID=UPI001126A45F|nr:hypothetical protein [Mesorhizobium sp. B2-3-11]TPL94264.1 hypothetical protein FJ960_28045 [Mesorhizobium sp. B2-3-11]
MIVSHIDMAQAMIDASFLSQHRSMADITSLRGDIAQTRRAIAASRELLKRLRQRKIGEALRDAEHHRVSAWDADIVRKVFEDLVVEVKTPRSQWRAVAQYLVHEFTGSERVEPALVDWIIRK